MCHGVFCVTNLNQKRDRDAEKGIETEREEEEESRETTALSIAPLGTLYVELQ